MLFFQRAAVFRPYFRTAFSPLQVVCFSTVPAFFCSHVVAFVCDCNRKPFLSLPARGSLLLGWFTAFSSMFPDFLPQLSSARLCSPMCGKSRPFSSGLDSFRVTAFFEPLHILFQIQDEIKEFLTT